MSLITDASFLIHEMRIKLLRTDERGERVISFRPTVMSDDYIRLAAPTYPEMQYCYSPTYENYLNNKTVSLLSSPRTKRSHYRLRKKENMQLNPPVPLTKQPASEAEDNNNNNSNNVSNNDANATNRHDKPLPPTPLRKQSAPTLCVTEASKAQASSSRPRFADDTAAMPSLHKETVIRSHTRTTSSTTFSFHAGGSENATITSLHPSIESTIDPSPRSSPDASEQQSSFSLPQASEAPSRKEKEEIEEGEAASAAEPAKEELPPLEYTKVKLTPVARPAPPPPAPGPPLPRIAIPVENMRRRRRYPRQAMQQGSSSSSSSSVSPSAAAAADTPPKPAPPKSALTALIAERASTADNPFAEFSFVSGRGEISPITLCVYLPHSSQPTEPVSLVVKPDAIIDDVIGYILYDYVEKKRKPPLEENVYDLANWMLRIAEEDGEIEEDLPALDRMRQISMVSFDQFALCRTPEGQVKQNEAIRAKMGRSGPTADSTKNKSSGNEPAASSQLANGQEKADLGPLDPVPVGPIHHQPEADSSAVAVPIPSSKAMLTKSTMPMTPLKYFRIRLMTNEEVSATTTIPVYAEMFIGDVLELVSRKRKLDPDEYMLTIADTNVVVPNDTTVESMREVTELCLIRKGAGLTIPSSSHIWRSPTKKKKDEIFYPTMFNTSSNTTTNNGIYSQYKKYFVNRKMPMFVGRRECIIAIDGDYVHIMPPEHKGMFDSVKTTSFHVNAVVSCKQSKKAPANFKITVTKDQSHKAYDFEAMNSKEAQEICSRINFLVQVCKAS